MIHITIRENFVFLREFFPAARSEVAQICNLQI